MMLTMAQHGNVLSDSQESVLFDPSIMDHLQNEVGIDFLEEAIMEQPERKCDLNAYYRHGGDLQYPLLHGPSPIPSREELAGPYNFQLMLNTQGSSKNWIYSQPLSKVFINIDEVLPLRFKWEPVREGLFLRTKMVYSLEQHRRDPVIRCHNHIAMPSNSNTGLDVNTMKYVFRCLETQSRYEEMHGGHLSIVTPLGTPEVGSMYVPVHFKFQCKNSCTSGMNRRATELIFTLENGREVLGRRRLQVRICSCPKRDKEKEEADAIGGQRPPTKKRKLEKTEPALPPLGKKACPEEMTVFNLNLEILGKEAAIAVKKSAYDIMAGIALRTGQMELYKPYLNKIFI